MQGPSPPSFTISALEGGGNRRSSARSDKRRRTEQVSALILFLSNSSKVLWNISLKAKLVRKDPSICCGQSPNGNRLTQRVVTMYSSKLPDLVTPERMLRSFIGVVFWTILQQQLWPRKVCGWSAPRYGLILCHCRSRLLLLIGN